MMMKLPQNPELRLLLACARAHAGASDEIAIRGLLEEGVDWTKFVQKAVAHGLVGLAGHTLTRLVPDAMPDDIRAAFAAFVKRTRGSNQTLLDELSQLIAALAEGGVEAIPFKGPVLAKQAFGDLGLRGFRDLDFLIRDRDVDKTVAVLGACGYEREGKLTQAQFEVIQRLQGQDILFKPDVVAVEPHTRLISLKMALDIDYDGLWNRARFEEVFGHDMKVFAPEDTLLILAIHGGKELWWDLKWACDVADFIAAHPALDWNAIESRARAQGCYRMLLVAASLAQTYLGANIPKIIAEAKARDPMVDGIVGRILSRWEADDPGGPPSNKTLSRDRLLLHDGILRQASYIMRTWLLPGPQHIPLIALPRGLSFAYVPLGLLHDLVALPAYQAYQLLVTGTRTFRERLVLSPLAVTLAPISSKAKKHLMRQQRTHEKALQAITANPADHVAWVSMAEALICLKQYQQAIAAFDKALAIMPDQRSVWQRRGVAIAALKKTGKFPNLTDAPEFDTKDANGWAVRAGFLSACQRYADAAEASECALQLEPSHKAATRIAINSRLYSCNWSKREADKQTVRMALKSGEAILRPMSLKLITDSEPDSLANNRFWTSRSLWSHTPFPRGGRYTHDKIRVAYLSTDFRSHPVGVTIVAPLEHHDKSRFEITALSLHPGDTGETRRRIEAAVNHFVDARPMGDVSAAALLHDMEIDIAVDLNGLTGSRRAGILLRRPAPVQVNFLGFPGTMAAPYMDYIIADPVVIPADNQAFYTEKIAYLPHAYLPYDRHRQISETPSSRTAEGLPETGFVFASFNSLHKISPEIFDVWMRLLKAIEGSVLWIPGSDPKVIANLRREAAVRAVAPERIVFARYAKRTEDHLARQRLADLFLDTFPYNAHTTASDALWVGLPVLTCQGQAFQARVAASLLRAIGLPELVTTSLADYEKRALELVRDPDQLAAIRKRLAGNRDSTPLFDVVQFTRDLESAYVAMWERQRSNLPPESFLVAP